MNPFGKGEVTEAKETESVDAKLAKSELGKKAEKLTQELQKKGADAVDKTGAVEIGIRVGPVGPYIRWEPEKQNRSNGTSDVSSVHS